MQRIKIELHLEDAEVEKLDVLAGLQKRSRKNFCETQIIAIINGHKKVAEFDVLAELAAPKHIPNSKIEIVQGVAEIRQAEQKEPKEVYGGSKENLERIKELEAELKNPPKSPLIGIKAWKAIRENELAKLKKES